MNSNGFVRQPITRVVAKGLRAAAKGQVFEGHRFNYEALEELWISADEHHIVCTHRGDPLWQYWTDTPAGGGWHMASTHPTLDAACSAVLDSEPEDLQPESGKYVVARLSGVHREIRVPVRFREAQEHIVKIFTEMGYEVSVEEVGEAVPIERTG